MYPKCCRRMNGEDTHTPSGLHFPTSARRGTITAWTSTGTRRSPTQFTSVSMVARALIAPPPGIASAGASTGPSGPRSGSVARRSQSCRNLMPDPGHGGNLRPISSRSCLLAIGLFPRPLSHHHRTCHCMGHLASRNYVISTRTGPARPAASATACAGRMSPPSSRRPVRGVANAPDDRRHVNLHEGPGDDQRGDADGGATRHLAPEVLTTHDPVLIDPVHVDQV